jgi:hypothetical protein
LTMNSLDAAQLKIHLLDVGTEKFGDCLVCELGDRRILIDGAHIGDYRRRGERPSIPEQFQELFGHAAPFKFDLLVVTHCHADHIGCLPKLVADRTIEVETALVADEALGFGRTPDFQPTHPDALGLAERLAAALREEDHTHLPDARLAAFLEDIATMESRYREMLATLEQRQTNVIRYTGGSERLEIERLFRDFGLQVLGPTREQLQVCADAIARLNERTEGDAARYADPNLVSLYRSLVGQADAAGAEDRPGKGAALNNQSIVLKLRVDNATALLGGDMQFAKPEVSGLGDLMRRLRETIKSAGPYRFIKLTHHASYNGFDESLLREWSPSKSYAHTGGLNDATHPDPGVLELLDHNRSRLQWARTDRNGLITVTFPQTGPHFEIAFGELNDATPNGNDLSGPTSNQPAATPQVKVESSSTGDTEITTTVRVGPDVTRVSMTFEIGRLPASQPTDIPRPPAVVIRRPVITMPLRPRLASGRQLPKLLFVTNRPRLENNIGATEASDAIQLIRSGGQTVFDVQQPANPWPEIRAHLTGSSYQGVVILGGYDVLPAQKLDTLPPTLRSQLRSPGDSDNFIVWNDEAYGDRDGDSFPEVPVTRIPDAKSPRLVTNALTANVSAGTKGRFGVRNIARPFATGPFNLLPGSAALLVSEPTTSSTTGPGNDAGDIVYFMLHGSDADATRFWGESAVSGTVEAANTANVPQSLAGVVFAGCCWGALTVDQRASLAVAGQPLGIRTAAQSMALSYLHAGCRAFIGCTGTHYSPTASPYAYFGGPMHTAVFRRLVGGMGPAEALFEAKIEYASGMPHGQFSTVGKAIEYKIWRQFTCLGLGW